MLASFVDHVVLAGNQQSLRVECSSAWSVEVGHGRSLSCGECHTTELPSARRDKQSRELNKERCEEMTEPNTISSSSAQDPDPGWVTCTQQSASTLQN